jgi:hypothetical protein
VVYRFAKNFFAFKKISGYMRGNVVTGFWPWLGKNSTQVYVGE